MKFSPKQNQFITRVHNEFTQEAVAIQCIDITSLTTQIKKLLIQNSLTSKQGEVFGESVTSSHRAFEKKCNTAFEEASTIEAKKKAAVQLSEDYHNFAPYSKSVSVDRALTELESFDSKIKEIHSDLKGKIDTLHYTLDEAKDAAKIFQEELRTGLLDKILKIQESITEDATTVNEEYNALVKRAENAEREKEQRDTPNKNYSTYDEICSSYNSLDNALILIKQDIKRIKGYVDKATHIQQDIEKLKAQITSVSTSEQAMARLAEAQEINQAMQKNNKDLGKNTQTGSYSAIGIINGKLKDLERKAKLAEKLNKPTAPGRMATLLDRMRLQEKNYPSDVMNTLARAILESVIEADEQDEKTQFENLNAFINTAQHKITQSKIAPEYVIPQKIWLNSLATYVNDILLETIGHPANPEEEYFAEAQRLFAKADLSNDDTVAIPDSAQARFKTIADLMHTWLLAATELKDKVDFAVHKAFFDKITAAVKAEFEAHKKAYQTEIEDLESRAKNTPQAKLEEAEKDHNELIKKARAIEKELLAIRARVEILSENEQEDKEQKTHIENTINSFMQKEKDFKSDVRELLHCPETTELNSYASFISSAIQEKEAHIEALNKHIQELDAQSSNTESELIATLDAHAALDKHLSEAGSLSQEITLLQAELSEITAQYNPMQSQLSEKITQKEALEKSLNDLQNVSSLIEQKKQKLSQSKKALSKLDTLMNKNIEEEQVLADHEAEHPEEHGKDEEKKNVLQNEQKKLIMKNETLMKKISQYNDELQEQIDKSNKLKAHILELTGQTAELESTSLEHYENIVRVTQTERQALARTIEELKAQENTLHQQLKEKEDEREKLTSDDYVALNELRQEAYLNTEKTLREQLEKVTLDLTQTKRELAEATTSLEKIMKLKTQCANAIENHERIGELEQLLAEISLRETEREQAQEALSKGEQSEAEIKESLAILENNIAILAEDDRQMAAEYFAILANLRIVRSVYAELEANEAVYTREPVASNEPIAGSATEQGKAGESVNKSMSNVLQVLSTAAREPVQSSFFRNGRKELRALQEAVSELAVEAPTASH